MKGILHVRLGFDSSVCWVLILSWSMSTILLSCSCLSSWPFFLSILISSVAISRSSYNCGNMLYLVVDINNLLFVSLEVLRRFSVGCALAGCKMPRVDLYFLSVFCAAYSVHKVSHTKCIVLQQYSKSAYNYAVACMHTTSQTEDCPDVAYFS